MNKFVYFIETDIFYSADFLPNVNSAHLNVKGQAKSTLLTKPQTKLLRHRTYTNEILVAKSNNIK